MTVEEALEISNKFAHGQKPYACTEYEDKYTFVYPDGGSCVHAVYKSNGKHEILYPMYQDMGKIIGIKEI